MLNFLKVKVVVNDRLIYPLAKEQPVLIPLERSGSRIVATDGYHITPPLDVPFQQVACFQVVCAIDNNRLIAGGVILVLFYLVGLTSGIWVLRLLSFLPIFYFLYRYYVDRRAFIQ